MARIVKAKVEVEGRWSDERVLVEGADLAAWPEALKQVGQPIPRLDGVDRALGRALYTQDLILPGMWHARILRSPHAHARITRIDASAALALRGVHAVLTHENAPPLPWYADSQLFDPHLRYAGEEVAAVLAESSARAEEALRAIQVEYDVLPSVAHPDEALAPKAPRLRKGGNLIGGKMAEYTRGRVVAALAAAPVRLELEVNTAAALHNALEPHGCVARWEGDRLTLWDSTQHVFGIRAGMAERLGLGLHQVRVIKNYMGGGFGAKNSVRKYMVIAALLARQSGRAVRCVLDRVEENLSTGHRHETRTRLALGASEKGVLCAIDADIRAAVGAHGAGMMPVGGPMRELYACPAVRTRESGAHVNLGPHTAFRAPGYVEGTFALETAMDQLARELAIDPFEIRRRNLSKLDPAMRVPYTRPLFGAALDAAEAGLKRWPKLKRVEGDLRRGRGVAAAIWGVGGGPPAHALVLVQSDGSLQVLCGTQDLGTGTRTVLTQVAAEEFGVPLGRVSLLLGDTGAAPHAPASWGSITVASTAPAVRLAAADARRQVDELALQAFGKARAKKMTFADRLAGLKDLLGQFTLTGRGARWPNPAGMRVAAFSVQAVQVAADVVTGEVRVERALCVHDCGRVLNPRLATSQVEGGFLQGLGFALMEGRAIDPLSNRVLNPSLLDYKVPTVRDMPRIETIFLPGADRKANNTGAVGIGEPPIIPAAAAIGNAIYDALGVRLLATPFTPKRVIDALVEREQSGAAEAAEAAEPAEAGARPGIIS